MDRARYLEEWSALHGGVRPAGIVGQWLRFVHAVVAPLARLGVRPWVLTLGGVVLAVLALLPAPSRPALAAVVVLASALCDGLDGTLAVLSGRVSRCGAVLDAVSDRITDACLIGVLWLAGAPVWWCLAAVGFGFGHEYLRAVAAAQGMSGVGRLTVGERPTRIIVTLVGLLAAGTPVLPYGWAVTTAVVALCGIGLVGLLQLVPVVHRSLHGPHPPR